MDVREETAQVRAWFEYMAAPELAADSIIELYWATVWREFGHKSWQAYCEAEFPVKPRWPKRVRVELVERLSDAGMSSREVGAVLGVDQKTVLGDLEPPEPKQVSIQAALKRLTKDALKVHDLLTDRPPTEFERRLCAVVARDVTGLLLPEESSSAGEVIELDAGRSHGPAA